MAKTEAIDWTRTDAGIMDQWLACCEAGTRYRSFFPGAGLDDRLQRLFAVACCRRVWPLLRDARSRTAVDVAELFADGSATDHQRAAAAAAADAAASAAYAARDAARAAAAAAAASAAYAADAAAAAAAAADAARAAARAAAAASAASAAYAADAAASAASAAYAADAAAADAADARAAAAEWKAQGEILVTFLAPEWEWSPAWTTPTVAAIATGIYQEKAFDRMPILADALQDAGCEDEQILLPLRTRTEWYRGCRILDCATGRR